MTTTYFLTPREFTLWKMEMKAPLNQVEEPDTYPALLVTQWHVASWHSVDERWVLNWKWITPQSFNCRGVEVSVTVGVTTRYLPPPKNGTRTVKREPWMESEAALKQPRRRVVLEDE